MSEADYYRNQAETCLGDAAAAVTSEARRQLTQLAQYYELQARWADEPRPVAPMPRA